MASLIAMIAVAACEKMPVEEEVPVEVQKTVRFTLTATYGEQDSKVSINEDGLNMSWTPGDVLYLVDPDEVNPTVTLSTDITEAAKTAKFITEDIVTPGEYIVLYGQDNLYVEKEISMVSTEDLASQVRLYGSLEVTDSMESAEITLHQLFAMLTFKFKNIPADGTITSMGMAVSEEGLKNLGTGTITAEGLSTTFSRDYKAYFLWNKGQDSKSLIAPVDLTNKDIYFFICGKNENGKQRTYEFVKEGINLKEGNNYNLTFDFEKASSVSTILTTESNAKILATPADFRAAAYWNSGLSFVIQSDIDFSCERYFPIRGFISGQQHTLSNITVDLEQCDYVGVLSEGNAYDLTVSESSFEGRNRVGAIVGSGRCESCCGNSVSINGEVQVGGLIGSANGKITSCSLSGSCRIKGSVRYVGGICGYSSSTVEKCIAKGDIKVAGGDMAGGIVGSTSGGVSECGYEGNVNGISIVGGVAGYGKCSNSYCYGKVHGDEYVGGVCGENGCSDCYHIGEVRGDGTFTGGISGSTQTLNISNCYHCGDILTGYGICYKLDSECSNNMTSSNTPTSDETYSEIGGYNATKTFLSDIERINGNSAYVSICWPDIDSMCPILKWQYEGYGGDVTIPGFEDQDW